MEAVETILAANNVVNAIAGAIERCGQINRGNLYSKILGSRMSIDTFHECLKILVSTNTIKIEGVSLVWVGGK